jgi:uncharacterized RDD family membrane protein YckC
MRHGHLAAALVITTPEDVALTLRTAAWHARLAAFAVDLMLMGVAVGLAVLAIDALATKADSDESAQLAAGLQRFATFSIATFYFILFELRWHGQTPGKRLLRLRVVMRDGGPLETGAIIIRNLTRDLETLLPLVAIANPEALGIDGGPRIVLFWLWLVALAVLPLLNRRHLRLGDLFGRTAVIALPTAVLLDDLSRARATPNDPPKASFAFTTAQLGHYGAHELQVLEGLLRHHAEDALGTGPSLLTVVAERIATRIDWHPPEGPTTSRFSDHASARAFLDAFYAAQRATLEGGLLLGRRR